MARLRTAFAIANAVAFSSSAPAQVAPKAFSGVPEMVLPLYPEVGAPSFTTPAGTAANGSTGGTGGGTGGESSETGPTSGATAVTGSGSTLTYTNADGSTTTLTGGSIAWRNNNPGNLRSGVGQIGTSNGFAVFPDLATGANALTALLQTPVYQALSVNDAISRYAPSSENNTASYQSSVSTALGVSGMTPLSSLSAAQMQTLQGAIRKVEGYNAGTISH